MPVPEEPGERDVRDGESSLAFVFNNPSTRSDTRKMLRISPALCLLTIGFPAGDAVGCPRNLQELILLYMFILTACIQETDTLWKIWIISAGLHQDAGRGIL